MLIKIGARYPFGACSYYRSYGVFPHLRRLDPSIRVEPVTKIDWTYIAGADILYLERPQDSEYVSAMKLAKNFGVKTWVDYDDDLFSVPSYNPTSGFYNKKEVRQAIIEALEMADVVTVATPAIKDVYSKYNNNIHVIPNAHNNYNYSIHVEPSKSNILSWRGSQTHRGDIIPVTREIIRLSKEYVGKWFWSFVAKDLWFLTDYMEPGSFTGADEMQLPNYMTFMRKTSPAILVYPLEMNTFNASKSNCAWLEATFSGACCVAPPLPEFDKPGIEHYTTTEDFYDKVKMLIEDPERRADNFKASLKYIQDNLLLSDVNKKRIDVSNLLLEMEVDNTMIFSDSTLAHKFCTGKGIELGAAAHNPFGLKNCLNVAPKSDEEFFKKSQIETCGMFAKIDVYADAEHIPFPDDSLDYVISSHVVEHIPDLIGAFIEWSRIVKNDGIIFMIFPKHNALASDVGRPLSTIDDFANAHNYPDVRSKNERDSLYKHIWVFDLDLMIRLISFCNENVFPEKIKWEILETEETDSKVGNGHTVIARVVK